jgi:hypothetical protein
LFDPGLQQSLANYTCHLAIKSRSVLFNPGHWPITRVIGKSTRESHLFDPGEFYVWPITRVNAIYTEMLSWDDNIFVPGLDFRSREVREPVQIHRTSQMKIRTDREWYKKSTWNFRQYKTVREPIMFSLGAPGTPRRHSQRHSQNPLSIY